MILLLQTPFERGEAVGRALGPCCCITMMGLFGLATVAIVLFFVRRSQAQKSPPPPSQYQWSPGAQPDFASMRKQQADALARLAPGQLPESEAINAAAKKLVAQDFDGAIAAYEDVAARFPHRAGDAHGQIGAAWFFKRDYDRAISHYRRAIELGAPPPRMEDNIREAEEAKRRG